MPLLHWWWTLLLCHQLASYHSILVKPLQCCAGALLLLVACPPLSALWHTAVCPLGRLSLCCTGVPAHMLAGLHAVLSGHIVCKGRPTGKRPMDQGSFQLPRMHSKLDLMHKTEATGAGLLASNVVSGALKVFLRTSMNWAQNRPSGNAVLVLAALNTCLPAEPLKDLLLVVVIIAADCDLSIVIRRNSRCSRLLRLYGRSLCFAIWLRDGA